MDGIIVIDKPQGITSHDVVDVIRKAAGQRRVGHLGTLDPLATGVLPVALGQATRLQQFYLSSRKAYEGVIRYGFSTSTYDSEGQPGSPAVIPAFSEETLTAKKSLFLGAIQQTPPVFSSKKISGISAHRMARKNLPVHLSPAAVHVFRFEISKRLGDEARFEVECSAGTYVRSLAHDLGQALGCGAHLKALRRTQSGEFTLQQAIPLTQIDQKTGQWKDRIIPLNKLVAWMQSLSVSENDREKILHGTSFPFQLKAEDSVEPTSQRRDSNRWLRLLDSAGRLIAIGELQVSTVQEEVCWIKPKIVFPSPTGPPSG
ncbi:MAG: tRNA pseudouridine(55) synthase TruB [Acidobacteriia bacterium]|nr:tRNA pseudouridine(55) synthase TruB [Terriglobia bacterium]